MLLSIIVPIYNVGSYIEECIKSVLSQTFKDFELILVNDGSNDNSLTICEKYQGLDSRIKVISKENGGLVSARKAGAQIAKGDYILCIDGDDYINENYLMKISQDICDNADVVFYGYNLVDIDGNLLYTHYDGVKEGIYNTDGLSEILQHFIFDRKLNGINMGSISFTIWSKVIKRELYTESQLSVPNSITFGEDLAVVSQVIKQAKSIKVVHYSGYSYRKNMQSMSHDISEKMISSCDQVVSILSKMKYDKETLAAYSFQVLFRFLQSAAKHSSSYSEYFSKYNTLLLYEDLYNCAISFKTKKIAIKDIVKIFLFRMKGGYLSYFLLKQL